MVILPEYVKFVMQREKMKKEQKTTTNKQETCPVLNVSCLPLKCVEKTFVTVVIYVMKITLHDTHTLKYVVNVIQQEDKLTTHYTHIIKAHCRFRFTCKMSFEESQVIGHTGYSLAE